MRGVARPLPPRPACTVAGCPADARVDVGLCGGHFRVWRLGQAALGNERREEAEAWAARQPQRLRANEFSLAALAPTVRVEVLFALQQRDAQGQRIDPLAGRGLVRALAGLDALGDDRAPRAARARRPPRDRQRLRPHGVADHRPDLRGVRRGLPHQAGHLGRARRSTSRHHGRSGAPTGR